VEVSFVGQKTTVNQANHACVFSRGSGHCPHGHSLGSLWTFLSCFAETVRGHPVGPFGGNICCSYWRTRFKRNLAFDGDVGSSNLDSWSRRRIRCGGLLKCRWKPVAVVMLAILLAFLVHPFGPSVFLYANWDKAIALGLVYPVSRFVNRRLNGRDSVKALAPAIGLIAFIATEMDDATGNLIFLLEAGRIFGLTAQMLPAMFIPYTFVDVGVRVLVGLVCAIVLTSVLVSVEKANLLRWPLT